MLIVLGGYQTMQGTPNNPLDLATWASRRDAEGVLAELIYRPGYDKHGYSFAQRDFGERTRLRQSSVGANPQVVPSRRVLPCGLAGYSAPQSTRVICVTCSTATSFHRVNDSVTADSRRPQTL